MSAAIDIKIRGANISTMDIATYRKENGLSQAALAALLTARGTPATQSLVSLWEGGATIPADRAVAIEKAIGIRCEDLRPDLTFIRSRAGDVTGYHVPIAGSAAA